VTPLCCGLSRCDRNPMGNRHAFEGEGNDTPVDPDEVTSTASFELPTDSDAQVGLRCSP
jgi:hypothetical protein